MNELNGLFSRYPPKVQDKITPLRELYPTLSEDQLVMLLEQRQMHYDLRAMIAGIELSLLNVEAYVIGAIGAQNAQKGLQKNGAKNPKKATKKRQSLAARSTYRRPALLVRHDAAIQG